PVLALVLCSLVHRGRHCFPTRRSSDLVAAAPDLRRALAHHWRRPAFQSVLSAAGLPWFAAMLLLRVGAPWWVLPAVLSGFLGAADRKSTRLNSSHEWISYAVFCLKKKT